MKKGLKRLFCLSTVLISLSACSDNSELEQLKAENAELKSQLETTEVTSTMTSETTKVIDSSDTIKSETPPSDDTLSENSCEYTKYILDSEMNHYAIVVLKNVSDDVIDVTADILLKDSSNNIIGVENDSAYNMAPGKEIAYYYSQENSFSDFDVNLSVEKVTDPSDIVNVDDIQTDISRSDNKLIISATNTTDKSTMLINEIVLYFKDGNLVDMDNPMFEDPTGIAPGQTSYTESHANVDFDDYKFYYDTYVWN